MPETVKIPLTQGKTAIVNFEDYENIPVLKKKWFAKIDEKSGKYYALRYESKDKFGKRPVLYMHRVVVNAKETEDVDHWNHDTLDNRKNNLRRCSHAQNTKFKQKRKSTATSAFKGVRFRTDNGQKPWQSRISCDGKSYFLGHFKTEIEAAHAYDAAAKMFGDFALLNFPEAGAGEKN